MVSGEERKSLHELSHMKVNVCVISKTTTSVHVK